MSVLPASNGDLAHDEELAIEAARAAIEQEFKIAERNEAKSRNLLGAIAAWFAVVQPAAVFALRDSANTTETGYLVASLIIAAAVAGAAAFVVLVLHVRAWGLKDEEDVAPEGLHEMLAAARDPHRDFASDLITHYSDLLTTRRANNAARAHTFDIARRWVIVAAMTTLVELAVAVTILGRA